MSQGGHLPPGLEQALSLGETEAVRGQGSADLKPAPSPPCEDCMGGQMAAGGVLHDAVLRCGAWAGPGWGRDNAELFWLMVQRLPHGDINH